MGSDYYNFQIFAGQENATTVRKRLIAALGFRPERQVDLNLVRLKETDDVEFSPNIPAAVSVGPPGPWIALYDSWFGPHDDSLSLYLSTIAPIVVISMDDSAAVHFDLYRRGELIDQFANRSSVITRWESEEQKQRFRGRPELWGDLLLHSSDTSRLRLVWEEGGYANDILDATIALFGWHPLLSSSGYTVDHDGIPEYYRDYVDRLQTTNCDPKRQNEPLSWTGNFVDLGAFTEFEPDLPLHAT
jgi:hypothetical protein